MSHSRNISSPPFTLPQFLFTRQILNSAVLGAPGNKRANLMIKNYCNFVAIEGEVLGVKAYEGKATAGGVWDPKIHTKQVAPSRKFRSRAWCSMILQLSAAHLQCSCATYSLTILEQSQNTSPNDVIVLSPAALQAVEFKAVLWVTD